jgi:DNA recombination protein RmuC
MEHELRDQDNKALYSEFSGEKMRPDAVVKYPDERNVIIDSKVSLTYFSELVEETDLKNIRKSSVFIWLL